MCSRSASVLQHHFPRVTTRDLAGTVRAQAPYRSDRNEGWLKIKTVQKGKFPVIGFVKNPSGVAALYLGKREGKELVDNPPRKRGLFAEASRPAASGGKRPFVRRQPVPRPIRTHHIGTRLAKGAYARFPIGTTFPLLRGTRDTTAALARSSKAVAMYFA